MDPEASRTADDLYGFLAASERFSSFRMRELFGQVGFGTGGWDTDYPNSILEILRVVITAADDHHRGIVGGSQQLPMRLWTDSPTNTIKLLPLACKASLKSWRVGSCLRAGHQG